MPYRLIYLTLPHNSVASDPHYILTSAGYQNGYPCRVRSVVCEWSPLAATRRFEPATPQWSSAFLPPSRIAPTGFELAPSGVCLLPQRHLDSSRSPLGRGNQDEGSWPWAAHMGSECISLRLHLVASATPFFLTVTYGATLRTPGTPGPSQYHDIYGTLTNPLLIASPIP